MKKSIITSILCIIFALSGLSQKKPYVTSGAEIIHSEATISDTKNPDASSALSFATIISVQNMLNIDMSEKFGLFTGQGYRNVGNIYDEYTTRGPLAEMTTPIKKKIRTYNICIPIGLKIGIMNDLFFYRGYEIGFPFVCKEKTSNADNEKINTDVFWFSNRTLNVQQSWLVSVQIPYGINLKFKYYITEFYNQDLVANGVKPFTGLNFKI